MRRLSLILIFIFLSIPVHSATIMVTGTSNWGGYKDFTGDDIIVTSTGEISVVSSLTLTCENLTISNGGTINANGKGYGSSSGPGQGGDSAYSGGGAGYGGKGGKGYLSTSGGNAYGSSIEPTDLGSGGGRDTGGGDGGAGGGAIRLIVNGTLTLDGTITANGTDGAKGNGGGGGGGSGGSIWVNCDILAGNGSFHADGGAGYNDVGNNDGGGGAGGRIAVYFNSSTFADMRNSTVNGGWGYEYGEPGTLAFFDNTANNMFIVQGWRWQPGEGPFNYNEIHFYNSPRIVTVTSSTITVANALKVSNCTWTYQNNANLKISAPDIDFYNSTVSAKDKIELETSADMILENSTLSATSNSINSGYNLTLINGSSIINGNFILSCNNLTIDSSSSISANGKGYSGSSGPGAGGDSAYAGGGAGYGGKGGKGWLSTPGGNPYGSSLYPTDLGSGGGRDTGGGAGGTGGGAIRLIVNGTLTLDGTITANGTDGAKGNGGGGGGGSGGSIWVNCDILAGNGSFHADGGAGYNDVGNNDGGGGAGGRIAVYFNSSTFADMRNSTVNGGWGYEYGEPGTLAFFDNTGNNMYIVQGWRWQPGEDPFLNNFHFGSLKIIDAQDNIYTLTNVNITLTDQLYITNSDWDAGSYNLNLQGAKNITICSGTTITANELNLQSTKSASIARNVTISAPNGSVSIKSGTLDLEDVSISIPNLYITVTNTMNIFKNSFLRGSSGGKISINLSNNLDIVNSVIKSTTNIFNSDSDLTFSSSSNIGNIFITAGNLTQTSGSVFDATGKGFPSGEGPGTVLQSGNNQGGGGAGYGGTGGDGAGGFAGGNWYGSAINPTNLGSGGGEAFGGVAGGNGGGIVRINVAGNYNCNEVVKADGSDGANSGGYGSGGGSGGSIYINCGSLSGNGYFTANGGAGGDATSYDGGGGAGGRIAVYYDSSTFTGEPNSRVDGGDGHSAESGSKGTLAFFDKINKSMSIYQGWQWLAGEDPFANNYSFKDLTINNAGNIYSELTNMNLNASDTLSITSSTMWNPSANLGLYGADITINSVGVSGKNITILPTTSLADLAQCNIIASNNLNIDIPNTLNINNTKLDAENLNLQTQNDLSVINFSEVSGNLDLTVPNLYIEFGSKISADGKGFKPGEGAGYGASGGANQGGGGAGYGGLGADGSGPTPGGNVYGSSNMPVDKGSGGGNSGIFAGGKGGRGGGIIKLNVTGTLELEGTITANGDNGNTNNSCGGGGGSGGSIYVYANTLTSPTFGFGAFHSDGGKGGDTTYWGGGGAGGRIAVYCYNMDSSFDTNLSSVNPGTNGDNSLTAGKGTLIFKSSVHSPIIKIVSLDLRPDGSNIVDVAVKIFDADGDNTQLKMLYLHPTTGEYSNCYLAGPVSVSYTDTAGVPDINNTNMYQLGVTTGHKIVTSSGTNTVAFSWISTNNIPNPSGTYYIKLIANDHQVDSGSAVTSIDIGNVEPIINVADAIQNPDGSEQVNIKLRIWDADGNKCRAKILWSASSNGPFVSATLKSNSAVAKYNDTGGAPSVDINSNYQIGSRTNYRIVTLPTTNEVDFIWDAKKDSPGAEGMYWIQIIGNDFQLDSTPATVAVKLGNHSPQASILSAVHDDDNFGYIKIRVRVSDIDKDELRLKVGYSSDNSEYNECHIVDNVRDKYNNKIFVDNSKSYQIGDKTGEGINTTSGPNEIIFYWDKIKDIGNRYGNYWLRITINDGTVDGTPVLREVQIINVPVDDAIVSDNLLETAEEKSVVQFNLSKDMEVYIGVYDIRGYEIKKIDERRYSSGIHKVEWDGTTETGNNVANGRYWLVIKTDKWKKIIPLVVVR